MTMRGLLLPLALACLAVCVPAAAESSKPNALEPQKATIRPRELNVVEIPLLIERLEREAPLDAHGRMLRSDLIDWLQATKDYTVVVCDIIRPVPDPSTPNGSELLFQYMFGNVAYQMTHPGEDDESKRQVAGIESMLNAYVTMAARDGKARIAEFDALIAQRAEKPLATLLAPAIAERCSDQAE
jgi:hypothetical protein